MYQRAAQAKARTVAHHHKHVKPAAAAAKGATGHAHKHHKAAKHHAKATKHKGTVARGLAIGAEVACCAAEALAASLRLSGLPVGAEDMLTLHRLSGADDEAGAPILATLEAASAFGLAGFRPVFATIDPDRASGECMRLWRRGLSEELDSSWERERSPGSIPGPDVCTGSSVAERSLSDALILGVDLPGPHTVLATPDGWWSWGELWCPECEWPDAVIEEAWAVSWA